MKPEAVPRVLVGAYLIVASLSELMQGLQLVGVKPTSLTTQREASFN